MATTLITCPGCGSKLRLQLASSTVRFRCPRCGHVGTYPPGEPLEGALELLGHSGTELAADRALTRSRPARRTRSSGSRTVLYAVLGGGAAVILAVALLLLWLFSGSGTPSAPSAALYDTAGAPAPPGPPPAPEPPPVKPIKADRLGWYAKYLPAHSVVVIASRPGKVLQSRVFREATAPISMATQMALLGLQQSIGVPPTQLEGTVVALGVEPSQGAVPSVRTLVALKSAVPFPSNKLGEHAEEATYQGKTYYKRPLRTVFHRPAGQAPLPALPGALVDQTIGTCQIEPGLVITATEAWLHAIMDGTVATDRLAPELALALGGLENVDRLDVVIAVSLTDQVRTLSLNLGMLNVRTRTPSAGPSGAGAEDSSIVPMVGPNDIRAMAIGIQADETLRIGISVVCQDDAAAPGVHMALASLKGTVPPRVEAKIYELKVQGPQGQATAQQVLADRIVEGLDALRQAIDRMDVQIRGRVVLARLDLPGNAVASLMILLQQQLSEVAAQHAAQTGDGSDAEPSPAAGFPSSAPPPSSPVPGFPSSDGFPRDESTSDQ